ncbi:AP2-like ethylene-responsive transcription factor SNZ [Tetrabaena socialis]|uniref:AP2-like ethylene-responsive transcription factor SNZ n=1 Tax=Tetrabaena socialis TaxID=47790 RepID=A0A2J8A1Z1_9CHLO|nr:AP2-like ethylene-responsive transcription factor SNZ [Tetrabaena socialis]|eukprot:PNH06532.1 AP2-like ethylene-responsive transcription factor SNZ [Tetrabaena socialis]
MRSRATAPDDEYEVGTSGGDDEGGGTQRNGEQRALSSKFRGVCWNRKNKRWQAAINTGGKYVYLGSFTAEHDAARAFDNAAIKLRGSKGTAGAEARGGFRAAHQLQLPELVQQLQEAAAGMQPGGA